MAKQNKNLLTVHQIWQEDLIYWIKTYKTLLKYVSIEYKDIFDPIIKGKNSGKRYYIERENIEKFIEMFENNKLNQ